ncbi:LCP family protein [Acetanaerobacterium elongatum]|uniref:Transcriptional attenuator, LytR family n=1 Tax=Acetanaerobacterium elongatum TaxID=258515 RepID=A0A1G9VB80_9FIRM|nr:LCP family protein [Acetanaerobacterium elongatum]SDM69326.1 transcriptional attenuator, LytR family [Acetanaerobacterium elongatum]
MMKRAGVRRLKVFSIAFGVSVVILSLIFIPIMLEVSPLRDYTPSSSIPSSAAPIAYTPVVSDNLTALVIITEAGKARYFLLVRFNPVKGQLPVTSLPYNMQVRAGGKNNTLQGYDAYGGTLEVKRIVEDVLDINISRTARLSTENFIKAVNTLGTVKYTIPYTLIYKNVNANIYINIPKGNQVLDGHAVYDLFRYPSYTEGEAHRYKVQSDVLAALINQRLNDWLIAHSDSVFKTLINLAETDISHSDYAKSLPMLRYFATQLYEPAVPVFPAGQFKSEGFLLSQKSLDALKGYYGGAEATSLGASSVETESENPVNP